MSNLVKLGKKPVNWDNEMAFFARHKKVVKVRKVGWRYGKSDVKIKS